MAVAPATDAPVLDPPTPDPGPTPDPKPTPAPQPTAATPSTAEFFETYKAVTGDDVSGKYASPEEAMKGLAEAARTVGRRDEDAVNYRRLDALLVGRDPEDVRAFFEGGPPQPAPPAPAPKDGDDGLPTSPAELQVWESQIYDDQGNLRPNADRGTVEKVRRVNQQIQAAALQLARDPKALLKPMIDDLRKELLEATGNSTQEHLAENRRQGEMEELLQKHDEILFVNGDRNRLSDLGTKVKTELDSLINNEGMTQGAGAMRTALKIVLASQPRPNNTQPTSQHASRQAPVGPGPPPTADDLEDRLRKDGLAVILMEQEAQRKK